MHFIVSAIIQQLESELATAKNASEQAHSSATHSENVADNKYDTLGLEAAYLAHGQTVRIVELQETIALYKHFNMPNLNQHSPIQIGALVSLENQQGELQQLFIGPSAGGLVINTEQLPIKVVTIAAPIGKALLNKYLDDEVAITVNQHTQHFMIINIQ